MSEDTPTRPPRATDSGPAPAEPVLRRISELAADLKRRGEDETPCDDYHRGYKFCSLNLAYNLEAALRLPALAPVPVTEAEGLEGRVRAAVAKLRTRSRNALKEAQDCATRGADSSRTYQLGKRQANKDAADLLEAALSAAPPQPAPPVTPAVEPGMLTDAEGWKVWREIRAAWGEITLEPSTRGDGEEYCRITEWSETGSGAVYEAYGPDPLRAFSKAVAAYRAATEGGGGAQEKGTAGE